jgi:hypothetical protein
VQRRRIFGVVALLLVLLLAGAAFVAIQPPKERQSPEGRQD